MSDNFLERTQRILPVSLVRGRVRRTAKPRLYMSLAAKRGHTCSTKVNVLTKSALLGFKHLPPPSFEQELFPYSRTKHRSGKDERENHNVILAPFSNIMLC